MEVTDNAENEALLRQTRNELAIRQGIPPLGARIFSEHGIKFVVGAHIFLPTADTVAKWNAGSKEDPEDLFPVILPENLSRQLTDFMCAVDRCTTSVFTVVDTVPATRKRAVPNHNSIDSACIPGAIVVYLDAVRLHETVFAHEIGHAWVQYVDQCEDERTMKDVSDPARLHLLQFVQSYVLDLKVNELLRRKEFDMDQIDGDSAHAMLFLHDALRAGYQPPSKREALFMALQTAAQIVEHERGYAGHLVRTDAALWGIRRLNPEIYGLAANMARSVSDPGLESKGAVRRAIDKCLEAAFAYTGDPLDLEAELIVPPDKEPEFDKFPDWIPGALPRVKCEIGRIMALNDIPAESTWQIRFERIGGAEISFGLPDRSIVGPWTIPISYPEWRVLETKEIHRMNREKQDPLARYRLPGGQVPKPTPNPQSVSLASPATALVVLPTIPAPNVPLPPGRRSYMAGLGRFLTQARLQERLDGEHAYGYCANNPTSCVDPSGLRVRWCYRPVTSICTRPWACHWFLLTNECGCVGYGPGGIMWSCLENLAGWPIEDLTCTDLGLSKKEEHCICELAKNADKGWILCGGKWLGKYDPVIQNCQLFVQCLLSKCTSIFKKSKGKP